MCVQEAASSGFSEQFAKQVAHFQRRRHSYGASLFTLVTAGLTAQGRAHLDVSSLVPHLQDKLSEQGLQDPAPLGGLLLAPPLLHMTLQHSSLSSSDASGRPHLCAFVPVPFAWNALLSLVRPSENSYSSLKTQLRFPDSRVPPLWLHIPCLAISILSCCFSGGRLSP